MTPKEKTLSISDMHGFLTGPVDNWCNHRGLLLLGLSLTKGPVLELGSGDGSTPLLRAYCEEHKREFTSLDYDKEWAFKMGTTHVPGDWESVGFKKCGLAFIDNSPGETRQGLLERLIGIADIVVCHDTEIGGAGAYGWDFSEAKYQLHYNRTGGGAGATAVSNKIDLNQFAGQTLGGYKFDV